MRLSACSPSAPIRSGKVLDSPNFPPPPGGGCWRSRHVRWPRTATASLPRARVRANMQVALGAAPRKSVVRLTRHRRVVDIRAPGDRTSMVGRWGRARGRPSRCSPYARFRSCRCRRGLSERSNWRRRGAPRRRGSHQEVSRALEKPASSTRLPNALLRSRDPRARTMLTRAAGVHASGERDPAAVAPIAVPQLVRRRLVALEQGRRGIVCCCGDDGGSRRARPRHAAGHRRRSPIRSADVSREREFLRFHRSRRPRFSLPGDG